MYASVPGIALNHSQGGALPLPHRLVSICGRLAFTATLLYFKAYYTYHSIPALLGAKNSIPVYVPVSSTTFAKLVKNLGSVVFVLGRRF